MTFEEWDGGGGGELVESLFIWDIKTLPIRKRLILMYDVLFNGYHPKRTM